MIQTFSAFRISGALECFVEEYKCVFLQGIHHGCEFAHLLLKASCIVALAEFLFRL